MSMPSDEVMPPVVGPRDPSLAPGKLDIWDVYSVPPTQIFHKSDITVFFGNKENRVVSSRQKPQQFRDLPQPKRTLRPRSKYVQRANSRKIFDLDEFPALPGAPIALRNFKDDPALYSTLRGCSEMVLEVYNKKKKGRLYTLVDISKVNHRLGPVSSYYITFTAKRPGMDLCTFRGEVSEDIAGRKEVVSFKGPDKKRLRD